MKTFLVLLLVGAAFTLAACGTHSGSVSGSGAGSGAFQGSGEISATGQ